MWKINRLKIQKNSKNAKAPSSVGSVKLIGRLYRPRPPASATKSWKNPKWPENDQFRQFDFLIKRFFGSSYTPFDAELQMEFFEITCRSIGCTVIELLTKNVSKNRSTKFRPPDGHGSRKVHFRWRLGIQPNLVEMLSALIWMCWPSFICNKFILLKKNNIENQQLPLLQRWHRLNSI